MVEKDKNGNEDNGKDFWYRIMAWVGKLSLYFGSKCNGFLYEIIIGLLYPKIDSHVSAGTNHL